MSIEQSLYALLTANAPLTALVGNNIYPTVPTDDTSLPFIVYSFTSADPDKTLDGPTGLVTYEMEITVWDVNAESVLNIGAVVSGLLNGYRGGQFRGIFLKNDVLEKEEEGYSKTQTYKVFGTTVNIIAEPASTGLVTTGNDLVSLSAGGHTLTLNTDGLTLDGGAVGGSGGVDLDPQLHSVNLLDSTTTAYGSISLNDSVYTFSESSQPAYIRAAQVNVTEQIGIYDPINDWLPSITVGDNTFNFNSPGGGLADIAVHGGSAVTFTAGGSTVDVPLTAQAIPGQLAPLTEWRRANNTFALRVLLDGDRPVIQFGDTSSDQGLSFRNHAGSEFMRIQDNGAVYVSNFGTTGGLQIFDYGMSRGGSDGYIRFDSGGSPAVRLGGATTVNYTSTVRVESSGATYPTLVVRGVASQTADLFQCQDSTGAVLARVTKDGEVEVTTAAKGVVLKSPNGTRYRLSVTDTGTLTTAAV